MKKKICLILVVCFVVALATSVATATRPVPDGPWIQYEQTVKLERFLQPDELAEKLFEIEARARNEMVVEKIGESAGFNWPIHVVKFGEPDDDKAGILIDTQIHGDEAAGTEAAVNLIEYLAMSNNPQDKMILDEVTVWFVPMINPDGATLFEVEFGEGESLSQCMSRGNIQLWTPEEWGLDPDTPAPWYYRLDWFRREYGYDVNRDAHPHLDFDLNKHADQHSPADPEANVGWEPGFYVTPEARALASVFKELQPDLYVNHHHRYTDLVSEEDNRMCTLQICGQIVPLDREDTIIDDGVEYTYSLTEESLELSKQVNALVYQKLQRGNSPFGAITKFPVVHEPGEYVWFEGGLPGTTLGSFSMNDAAIMLYEVRGQQHPYGHTGQKASGLYISQSYTGLYETLLGFATGEVYEIDPDFYDEEIPPAGPRVGPKVSGTGF